MQLDAEIDRLYQLPLAEFTAARNELARRAGSRAAEIRTLSKPPLAAWAVNQLYWRDRKVYDALMESAEALRATHKSVLGGKRGDLRAAGKDHDEALEHALKATLKLLADSGHPVTDATRQAVGQTLRALPAEEPAGRLTRALQPGGFEMLAGITVKSGVRRPVQSIREQSQPEARKGRKQPAKEDAQADRIRAAREETTATARALREAEHAARRAEFESARAARAGTRADEQLAAAREELEAARARLAEADAQASEARRQAQSAARAAEAAQRDVHDARTRAESAQDRLERLTGRA